MIEKIGKRARILGAWVRGEGPARAVPLVEALHSMLQTYGVQKWLLRRRARIERAGDLCRFTLDGRTVYWPGEADVGRLVDMYFEVNCANAHRFDSAPTPVAKGDVVLDVGCCEGFFALRALEQGAGRVFCFEPGRATGRALARTFERQAAEGRVEIVGSLLGGAPGKLLFRENPSDPSVGAVIPFEAGKDEHCYTVPVTTLDTFVAEKGLARVDFLKVDVEGYELEVLRGGAEMIAKHRPKIAIAAYHRVAHAQEIRRLLSDIDGGYRFALRGLVEFDGIVRPVLLHCHVQADHGR